MPAYDYRCTSCDSLFEVNRPISDDSPVGCPACGGGTRKVFAPVGVVFKGSGFYNTDHRDKAASSEAKAQEGGAGPDGGPSGEAPCGASKSDGGACATCPAAAE